MKWISTLLLSLTLAFSAHAAEQRPNFVVIFTDDQTYRAIGYNNPVVKTPNLDKLAMEGVRLNRAYVASPICVASRASILTGAFPQQHAAVSLFSTGFKKSVVVEKRFVTLPIVLEQAGYHTALYGKSHLGEPTTFGFAEGRDIKAANDEETFEEADKFFQRESKSVFPASGPSINSPPCGMCETRNGSSTRRTNSMT
jgi:arylsulfatase A-like enzyme